MRRAFANPRSRFAVAGGFAVAAIAIFCAPATAEAKPRFLRAADYPGMTTFNCRMGPIPISAGQNLNLFEQAPSICPNARKVKGSGPVGAGVFASDSTTEGYITRFKPSMQEIKPGGKLVTPSVWDLHLHHVVWLGPNGTRMASGEEKTHVKLPQGYGAKVAGGNDWTVNHMIHALGAKSGRSVYLTWQIDWVPERDPERTDIKPALTRWLDVAGLPPNVYPVFDAERGYDTNGDGRFVFPDEAMDPGDPAYAEENGKISHAARQWTVPASGATLLFGAGHLHPGGLRVNLEVERDGQVKQLFRSDARYYEPAGAVSWDVSMEATRPGWRISLEPGDVVSLNVVYDIERASWYESMGILPLMYTTEEDDRARDPFTQTSAVERMYDAGGILTHGRLPENIDKRARKNLKLPDPRDLSSAGAVPPSGIDIDGFVYELGGYSAVEGFPRARMRPPTIGPGESVLFTNLDAQPGMPQSQQVWHSITSCKAPCNRDSGIGYPLANGPVKFDSGQLGFGTGGSEEVTTGGDEYETPPISEPGTYTYFCRIHPFMRGSFRVDDS
jgi:plastocyanin